MPWPLVIAFFAGSSGVMFFAFAETYRMLQGWKKTLESCGLTVVKFSKPWSYGMKLRAEDGPLEVRVDSSRHGIRVVVKVPE